jgi:hypothetical protein
MTGTGFGRLQSYWKSRLLKSSHCSPGGSFSSDCLCGSSSTNASDMAVMWALALTRHVQVVADMATAC